MGGIKDKSNTNSPASRVVKHLENLFPLELAEKWDNVGLLIDAEPSESKCTVFLTNDLTEKVLDEAIGVGADLIITYHPTPFRATKKLLYSNTADRIMLKCITNTIAVFSPHTACDNAYGGVNDWLINGLNIPGDVQPIEELPLEKSGRGRIMKLTNETTLGNVIQATKTLVGLEQLRVAFAVNLRDNTHTATSQNEMMMTTTINSIAVQAGSGASVLDGCDADVWISGEMSHHEMLAATAAGKTVVLTEHSNSERGFLTSLHATMAALSSTTLEGATFKVSAIDADPVLIV